jgi:hypothetical protein
MDKVIQEILEPCILIEPTSRLLAIVGAVQFPALLLSLLDPWAIVFNQFNFSFDHRA